MTMTGGSQEPAGDSTMAEGAHARPSLLRWREERGAPGSAQRLGGCAPCPSLGLLQGGGLGKGEACRQMLTRGHSWALGVRQVAGQTQTPWNSISSRRGGLGRKASSKIELWFAESCAELTLFSACFQTSSLHPGKPLGRSSTRWCMVKGEAPAFWDGLLLALSQVVLT